ncbi:MAG: hybrid sensor histidine kinase/response regulator [Planctomycetota bacterium]|nr:hybrid sensor histidine kinase/response regulator [Planctomycetota bacterium]
MGAAIGYAELEIQQQSRPESRRHLAYVVQLAQLASQLSMNVLYFASPVASTQGVVDEAVRAVLDLYSYRTRKGVEFEWSAAATLPTVAMPTGHLQLILANIIKNAMDAVAECPSATIRITAVPVARVLRLGVWNSGPAIPRQLLPKIFNPFFTTKARGKGSGLGLAVARRLTERAGGTLSARNTNGGVLFTLALPIAKPVAQDPIVPSIVARSALKGCRILVVDDEEPIRKVLQLMLKSMCGGSVRTCASGGVALQLLEREQFDAVVLDLRMPGISGQELYERLPKHLKKTVVFLTGDALWAMTNNFLNSTGQPALFKPVTQANLMAAIHKVTSA